MLCHDCQLGWVLTSQQFLLAEASVTNMCGTCNIWSLLSRVLADCSCMASVLAFHHHSYEDAHWFWNCAAAKLVQQRC
jgi:hypothetical protein